MTNHADLWRFVCAAFDDADEVNAARRGGELRAVAGAGTDPRRFCRVGNSVHGVTIGYTGKQLDVLLMKVHNWVFYFALTSLTSM